MNKILEQISVSYFYHDFQTQAETKQNNRQCIDQHDKATRAFASQGHPGLTLLRKYSENKSGSWSEGCGREG